MLKKTEEILKRYRFLSDALADAEVIADIPLWRKYSKEHADIRETAEKAGPFCSKSRCLPGFGLAAIESHPQGKDPESMGIFFGHNFGHAHRDTLNLFFGRCL